VAYANSYDAAVFSLPGYVPSGLTSPAGIIAPGIDPLNAKNRPLDALEAQRVIEGFGIDASRPLVTQVSRFDPWKDPIGVLEAWRLARKDIPDLQLALVGSTADDDPESVRVLEEVRRAVDQLADVYVIANEADDTTVNAFQTASTIVLQKSLREGFGLTVAEALWAGTPVVGGAVGGIPLQIQDGRTGFLVRTPQEAAARIIDLARDPNRRRRMGAAGREHVRERFLLPRMIADDIDLWSRVLSTSAGTKAVDSTFVRKAF
jgi:trehalose synthase